MRAAGRPSPRRRRSGCRRSASRRARRRTPAARAHSRSKRTWSSSAPGRRTRSSPRSSRRARSRKSSASAAVTGAPRLAEQPRRGGERRRATCRASRARPAARAAASATTSGRPPRASRSRRRRPDRAGRRAARWGAAAPRRYERGSCESTCRILHGEMPAPKRSEPPRRIRIAKPAPVLDDGRYAVKRTVGDTVAVSADIFRDGHEKLRAVVKYKAPGRATMARGAAARRRRPHQRRALGRRVHGRDRRALAVHVRGVDRPLGDLARRAAPQGRGRPRRGPLAARSPRASCSSSARWRAPRATPRTRSSTRSTSSATPTRRCTRSSTSRSGRSSSTRWRSLEREGATTLEKPIPLEVDRVRPASAPGTSSSRAPGAA